MVIERETEAAKQQLAAGNKDRALLALRRKKYQQTMLDKTFAQLLNLEQLVPCTLSLTPVCAYLDERHRICLG